MLSIILLILKIIGTILLVLLSILLIALLAVLFVPIRYLVNVEHGAEFFMQGRASWLFHIIHSRFSFNQGTLHIRVRVLGVLLYDNLKEKVQKKKKNKKSVKKKKASKSKKPAQVKPSKEKEVMTDNASDTIRIVEDDKRTDDQKGHAQDDKINELPEMLRKYSLFESKDEDEGEKLNIPHDEIVEQDLLTLDEIKAETYKAELYKAETFKSDTNKPVEVKLSIEKEEASKQENPERDQKVTETANNVESHQRLEQEAKTSFFKKIVLKITKIKEKLITLFQEWKNKIKKLFETATNIKQKIDLVLDFFKDELNREGFKITYSSLIKLLKHILPTKLKSKIIFGTGDPCSTGQALGAMSILYSFYGDKIRIIPDFENSRFEGTHFAKGRIRLITLLIIVIKLILDKRFKLLKRNFIILKEAL